MGHRVMPAWIGPIPSEHDGDSLPHLSENVNTGEKLEPASASTSKVGAHVSFGKLPSGVGAGGASEKPVSLDSLDPKGGADGAGKDHLALPGGAAAAASAQNGFEAPAASSYRSGSLPDASPSSSGATGRGHSDGSISMPGASASGSAARHASVTPAPGSPLENDPQLVGQQINSGASLVPTVENV